MGNNNKKFNVLVRRSDFLHLKTKGRRVSPTNWMTLNFNNNEFDNLRCGWTVPRQVGSAVVRNKLKRWCRDYFRSLIKTETESVAFDINIVIRPAKTAEFFKGMDRTEFFKALDLGWKGIRKKR